jgi:thioredoxin reductase (NADPH)
MTTRTRMPIIGSRPAELSAAIYGARAGMEPIVVRGLLTRGADQAAG